MTRRAKPVVDRTSPIDAATALKWLSGTESVRYLRNKEVAQASRADAEERVRLVDGYGLFRVLPDSPAAKIGHHLAIWNPAAPVGQIGFGYFTYYETTGPTPP